MELFHDMFFVNEKIRYSTGFSIPINKKIFLDFNYIFESEVNKNIKDNFHIFRSYDRLTKQFKEDIKMDYLNKILNMKSCCNIDQLIFGALFHLLILQIQ